MYAIDERSKHVYVNTYRSNSTVYVKIRYRRLFAVLLIAETERLSILRERNNSKSSKVNKSKAIDSLVCKPFIINNYDINFI